MDLNENELQVIHEALSMYLYHCSDRYQVMSIQLKVGKEFERVKGLESPLRPDVKIPDVLGMHNHDGIGKIKIVPTSNCHRYITIDGNTVCLALNLAQQVNGVLVSEIKVAAKIADNCPLIVKRVQYQLTELVEVKDNDLLYLQGGEEFFSRVRSGVSN